MMINIIDEKNCCGCSACYNACPKSAIKMENDEKGFLYPVVDKKRCINCGMCEKVCPVLNVSKIETEIKAYACYNKNEEERFNSSSGGIFILLAKEILNRNGVVFGAYFDENFNVKHGYAESLDEVYKFMTSKYVQSDMNISYKDVKRFLESDRYVLFTGTPCQIEGLKSYLKKDYDKLYMQDIICHGVPSPLIWDRYKSYRKRHDVEQPMQINFRYKVDGWNSYALLLQYNNSAYKTNHNDDLFIKSFLKNLTLRDSCYDCKFKGGYRASDITLADFWGINNILPDMNDDKGISLVIINSNKGKELIDSIKDKIEYKNVNVDEALKYNNSYNLSANYNKNRDSFFKEINDLNFDKLVKKYGKKDCLIKRVLKRIKRVFKH